MQFYFYLIFCCFFCGVVSLIMNFCTRLSLFDSSFKDCSEEEVVLGDVTSGPSPYSSSVLFAAKFGLYSQKEAIK